MLFRRRKSPSRPVFSAPLAPETPFYAVGDLHGVDTLFRSLLERFEAEAHPEARLVCVGDYIDRGEESAQLLRRLHEMQKQGGSDLMICLKGNHEEMLLQVLDAPQEAGPRWLRYGGLQTMASLGLAPPRATASTVEWEQARDRLAEALGPDLLDWLRDLPLSWKTGNVFVCHAGADPALPLDAQRDSTLLWGHESFFHVPREDGIWVVHGHTIQDEARAEAGRIGVDTGAYATGRLSAALVEPGQVRFLTA